ncbi:replication factor A [Halobacteriales archaeon QS_1_68_20]|nr:MAG: replication factor A [Halobacteriales archaeon QS_1_68_20]
MGAIEDIHEDLDADVSLEEFREAVEAKVEQMGGLADEETAAMLVAHELDDEEVEGVADVEPGMEEVTFLAKVVGVSDLRTFERDGDDEDGRVINVEVADESGSVRAAFWDQQAQAVDDGEIEVGDVLRIKGRPKEGLNGVEVSVDRAEVDDDAEVDIDLRDTYRVEDLSLGLSDVDLRGKLLDTDSIRTFDRDDGSQGRVSNLVVGDETGRIRVTLWDERADRAEELDPGVSVEVVDGYVRERDGDLELHVGDRGAVEVIDEDVEYVPDTTDIDDVEIGQTVDLAGVIRSADSKRTFERDDGSEGQVRNVRVQDGTGDIRVALWGEKADLDLGPGDEVHLADVRTEDGWQDDVEAAANWRSTVTVVDAAAPEPEETDDDATGLDAFAGDGGTATEDGDGGTQAGAGAGDGDASDDSAGGDAGGITAREDGESVSFTGTVVQAGDPVVLDDGEETLAVETGADVTLGQEVTARGTMRDGRLVADEVL